MQNAPAVGVSDGVANIDKPLQQLTELDAVKARGLQPVGFRMKTLDRVMQAIAFDESHGVERPAVGIRAQAIYRHNGRVLKPASNLRLRHEPRAVFRFPRKAFLKLFERDFAV